MEKSKELPKEFLNLVGKKFKIAPHYIGVYMIHKFKSEDHVSAYSIRRKDGTGEYNHESFNLEKVTPKGMYGYNYVNILTEKKEVHCYVPFKRIELIENQS